MKLNRIWMMFTVALGLAALPAFAIDPPYGYGNKTQAQSGPRDGSGQKMGNRGGKKAGPQDGSGPIHTPGTGGGTGAGTRAGRGRR
jgi:hypothetical protein